MRFAALGAKVVGLWVRIIVRWPNWPVPWPLRVQPRCSTIATRQELNRFVEKHRSLNDWLLDFLIFGGFASYLAKKLFCRLLPTSRSKLVSLSVQFVVAFFCLCKCQSEVTFRFLYACGNSSTWIKRLLNAQCFGRQIASVNCACFCGIHFFNTPLRRWNSLPFGRVNCVLICFGIKFLIAYGWMDAFVSRFQLILWEFARVPEAGCKIKKVGSQRRHYNFWRCNKYDRWSYSRLSRSVLFK